MKSRTVPQRTSRQGQFLDANTGKPIESKYDLGHVEGHEHRREVAKAEAEGLEQGDFNDRMKNPDLYQIEDPHENRSYVHEMKGNEQLQSNAANESEEMEM